MGIDAKNEHALVRMCGKMLDEKQYMKVAAVLSARGSHTMDFEMKITGLDNLMKTMNELEKALSNLDGEIAHLTLDPHDPQSIENAIQEFNAAVEEKVAGCSQSGMIAKVVEELKESGRTTILERAAAVRLKEGYDE